MKALAISDRANLERFASQQIYYSLQAREAEYELIPISIVQGVGILVWSPLAGGLLSGKYRRDAQAPAGSRHSTDWSEPPIRDWEQLYDLIETLIEVGDHHGVSAARVALADLLQKPGVTSLVIAARTEEQLADNLEAATLELTSSEVDQLGTISAPPLLYPYWHQLAMADDKRYSPADLSLLRPHLQEADS
jgi:aryl-alcohol dehydrogenase-like predicted oxidoreductase